MSPALAYFPEKTWSVPPALLPAISVIKSQTKAAVGMERLTLIKFNCLWVL